MSISDMYYYGLRNKATALQKLVMSNQRARNVSYLNVDIIFPELFDERIKYLLDSTQLFDAGDKLMREHGAELILSAETENFCHNQI